MRVADTSALFALYDASDSRHKEAIAAFRSAEPILVPHDIFVETMGVVARRHGFEAARDSGAHLRTLGHLEIQPTPDDIWDDLQGAAWRAFESSEGQLSHADAVVVAWCRKRHLKPLSFDKALVAAASA